MPENRLRWFGQVLSDMDNDGDKENESERLERKQKAKKG